MALILRFFFQINDSHHLLKNNINMNEIKGARTYEHQKTNTARVEIPLKGHSGIFHLLIPLLVG